MSAVEPQENPGGVARRHARKGRGAPRLAARAAVLVVAAGAVTATYAAAVGATSPAPAHQAAPPSRSASVTTPHGTSRALPAHPAVARPGTPAPSTPAPATKPTTPKAPPAQPATPAQPAQPTPPAQPATPAKPATPAQPAAPATTLVNGTGVQAGFWFVKVPAGWAHRNCGEAKPGVAEPAECSYWLTGSSVDVWYDPADPMQRVAVTTCLYWACGEGQAKNAVFPTLAAWFPVVSTFPISPWEIGFAGHAEGPPGQLALDGVVEAAHMGKELTFPLVTMSVQLPPAEHALATTILDDLVVEPPMHCGGR